jgi:hypothetical protein
MSERVIARLDDGALAKLVDLACDHLLDQPLHALVDAEWAAARIVEGMRSWSASEQNEAWLRAQIASLRARTPEGSLRTHLPNEITEPLERLVQRPYVPDRAIIGRLLGHKTVEALVRELLVGTLHSFAQRLKPSVPRSSRLRSLKRVGDGVLGGLGQVLEGQAESRVRDFVDTVMAQVMAQIADHICNPGHADAFGRFRHHLIAQLLDTDLADLDRELEKLDPDDLVHTTAAAVRALAHREGLQAEIVEICQSVLDESGDTPLRAHLDEAGIADAWHTEARSRITQSAAAFVQTDAFRAWLDGVLDPSEG